jgi:hypothetical protein
MLYDCDGHEADFTVTGIYFFLQKWVLTVVVHYCRSWEDF